MSLAVVIATMDRPAYVDRSIDWLHRSRVAPQEVVIVDSTHGPATREVVEKWAVGWPALRYVDAPNTGVSRARNLGVQASRADAILITDDDCLVREDAIGAILQTLAADLEVQCITGAVHPYGEAHGQVAVAIKDTAASSSWQGKSRPWGIGHSVNMSFRREAYWGVGGFDEELGPGTPLYAAEDLDILYRTLCAGYKVTYQPAAIVYHDQWRSRTEARGRRREYARGTAAFLSKHVLLQRDSYALRMVPARLWEDVPLLALRGLARRNLELELVALYQLWGLLVGFWVAGRYYARRARTPDRLVQAPA